MKKRMIIRGFQGFWQGIAICHCISIAISLVFAGGYYSPCVPSLVDAVGSEIGAVLVQALLSGVLGAGFGTASLIWERESWSLLKQTAVYFAVISAVMLPTAYLTYWMEHSAAGFLQYFGIFVLIFAAIWVIEIAAAKYTVYKMNQRIGK